MTTKDIECIRERERERKMRQRERGRATRRVLETNGEGQRAGSKVQKRSRREESDTTTG
jgi:hypothetical protein